MNTKYTILNFGPQHPSAHGVLRVILQLAGELIIKVDIHIGFLHRGVESLVTKSHIQQNLPHFDRLDYTSMNIQSHTYYDAINLATLNFSYKNQKLYTLLDEASRILNHLLSIGTHSIDLGHMGPAFWAFESRELIYEIFEQITGARMHYALYSKKALFTTTKFLTLLKLTIATLIKTITECYLALINNKVLKSRLILVGIYKNQFCKDLNITGPLARSSGLMIDDRFNYFNFNFIIYKNANIKTYLGAFGDSYDRLLIRFYEMFESIKIMNILYQKENFSQKNTNIEATISNFVTSKIYNCYTSTSLEGSKGLFAITIFIKNNSIISLKMRSPSFYNLFSLQALATKMYIADLTTLIGSIDVVFGEVDR